MEETVVDVASLKIDSDLFALALRELRLKYTILCHTTGHSMHGRKACVLCGYSPASDVDNLTEANFEKPLPVERE